MSSGEELSAELLIVLTVASVRCVPPRHGVKQLSDQWWQ